MSEEEGMENAGRVGSGESKREGARGWETAGESERNKEKVTEFSRSTRM